MTDDRFRFVLNMRSGDGRDLGQIALEPDWLPALECATFAAVRAGRVQARATIPAGAIEPAWHETLGEPYVAAFRAVVKGEDGESLCTPMPTTYVREFAEAASARLVAEGRLEAGEAFRYHVCAFPAVPAESDEVKRAAAGVCSAPLLPVAETAIEPFLDASQYSGEEGENDVPVFLPRQVLAEAFAMVRGARDVEVGGVMIGKLHFDSSRPEFFVEITALIPAPHGISTATKFTFTPETWAAVDAAIRLRGRGECPLSWIHSHPDWCKTCPAEKRRTCKSTNAFFSADDVLLHRTCFNRAFHTAMLISDNAARGLSASFFGWRHGVVAARGFHILDQEL